MSVLRPTVTSLFNITADPKPPSGSSGCFREAQGFIGVYGRASCQAFHRRAGWYTERSTVHSVQRGAFRKTE